MGRRFGWLWRPLLYAGVTVGFLLGRALPEGEAAAVAPFGVAFYAAVHGAGLGAQGGLVAAVAVLAGSVTVLGVPGAASVALALLTCHVACLVLRVGQRPPSVLSAAVAASAAAAVPAVLAFEPAKTVQMLFWVGLAGVLAQVFTLGISDVLAGRLLRRGAGDSPVPAIVLLASALCGLRGLQLWGWLSVRDAAAALAVLVSAYSGGPSLGAAAGGVMGIGLLFGRFSGGGTAPLGASPDGADPAVLGMLFVVAGLLAGTFRVLRKPGVGLAFALGFVALAMTLVEEMRSVLSLSGSAAVAVLLFWLVPRAALARLPDALVSTSDPPPEPETRPREGGAAMLERIRGMARVLKEVGRTFDQVAVVEAPREQPVRRVIDQVAERVCHSCSLQDHCWQKRFDKTYQLLDDLWAEANEDGPLTARALPDDLKVHCIFPDRIASTMDYLVDLYRSHRHWERQLEEGRNVVGGYVKNVARLLDRMADEAVPTGERCPETPTVLQVTAGVARLPKRGGQVSGDSYMAAALGEDRYMLALSDGMGVGRGAAVESKHCVRLLHELLAAGFATEVAVNTVNSALLLRSVEESFATLDLALLDLSTGRAEFVKIGAAPSFVKRGPDVTVVKVSSVPVGIINQIKVEPEFRSLRAGDMVVMVTDGIWDVSRNDLDKERWLIDYLSRETSADPEEVAERVLARALELAPEPVDDMTVLAARIGPFSGGRAVGEPKRTGGGEWVPVRAAPRSRGKGLPGRRRERDG